MTKLLSFLDLQLPNRFRATSSEPQSTDNKDNKDNKEPRKLHPLHPSVPDSVEYKDEITAVFSDPEIRNVAVSGPYGAGKSSVVEHIKNVRDNETWVTISLAHFEGFNENDDMQTLHSGVETAIINQLVHKIDLKQSQKSRFKVVRNRGRFVDFLVSVALVLFAVLTISLWPLDIGLIFTDDNLILKMEFAFWAVLAIFGVYKAVRIGIISRAVRRLKLFDAEVEFFADADSTSPFDRCLTDIVYLLNSSKTDVVVFEDLDRYGALPVFAKLRELNLLANDGRDAKSGTLRFFYLIKDSLFDEPRDRTKFFDFIIPVIPFVDPSNSHDVLIKSLNEAKLNVSDKGFLYQLSTFIDDPRILYELVNEAAHYADSLFTSKDVRDGDMERLIAMLSFKSYFPFDYECLQTKRGYVFSVLGRKPTLVDELTNSAKHELESLKSELEKIDENNTKARDAVQRKIMVVEKRMNQLPSLTIKELVAQSDNADVLFTFEAKNLARPADFEELHMGAVSCSPLFPMLRFLISGGWIDESYERYMSNFYPESISFRDADYLSLLRQAGSVDHGYIPDNPSEIVTRLDISTIARKGARNPYLFKALLEGNDEVKKRCFMDSLARDNDITFFANYIVTDLYLPSAFSEAINVMMSPIMDVIEDSCLSSSIKRLFTKRFLIFAMNGYVPDEDIASALSFANNDPLFLEADERVDTDELCVALRDTGYRALTIDFGSCDQKLIEAIYRKGMFEPNAKIIEGLLNMFHPIVGIQSLNSGDTLERVYVLDDDMLKKAVEREKDLSVSSILDESDDPLQEGQNCVLWIINDRNVSIACKQRYIERLSGIEVSNLSLVTELKLRSLLMEADLVSSSAENLVGYFKDCQLTIDTHMANLINSKGIPPLLTAKFVADHDIDEEVFLLKFISCDSIDPELTKHFLSQYDYRLKTLDKLNLDEEKVLALVESDTLLMNAEILNFLRVNFKSVVYRFAERDTDGYLSLVMPSESQSSICAFEEAEALRLLESEEFRTEEKLRLLTGFRNQVCLSSTYPDEVNIEIAKRHFNGDVASAMDLCTTASAKLRQALVTLLAQKVSLIVEGSLVVPSSILDDLLRNDRVEREEAIRLIIIWINGAKPAPPRAAICKHLESASLNEYVKLLSGTQSMIPCSSADDEFLTLLSNLRMCGKIATEINSHNLRKVYPKGASHRNR